jgi:hypothetical protein
MLIRIVNCETVNLFLSKTAYAERLGVQPSAVSNYIARGHLSPRAIRADGMINVALADADLSVSLDLVKSAGRGAETEAIAGPTAVVVDSEHLELSRSLLRARTAAAQAAATRAQIELATLRGDTLARAELEEAAFAAGQMVREAMEMRRGPLAARIVGLDVGAIVAVLAEADEACLTLAADEIERRFPPQAKPED